MGDPVGFVSSSLLKTFIFERVIHFPFLWCMWWLWSCRMGYYRGWQSEGGVQVIVKWQELVNHRNLTNEQPASRHLKNCPPRQALCYLHDVHTVCTHLRWSAPNSLFAKGELVRLAAHTYCHTLHTLSYLAYLHIPINAKHLHIIVCW